MRDLVDDVLSKYVRRNLDDSATGETEQVLAHSFWVVIGVVLMPRYVGEDSRT